MAKTLTTANSALALAVVGLFNTPQLIQGYSTDDSFAADDVSAIETAMGVDGYLSGGFTPVPTVLNINLQADSLSNDFFDAWINAQLQARELFIANGSILLTGIGKKFALSKGYLTTHSPMAGSKKILQPRKFTITFESISPANS